MQKYKNGYIDKAANKQKYKKVYIDKMSSM